MKSRLALLLLISLGVWTACQPDLERVAAAGDLQFSRDTVFLDTLFTRHSSATYTLKVYNRSNQDVYIPKIDLSKGASSSYRLNVDGLAGTSFENIEILARDSIFIFIETTVDLQQIEQNQFLYEDAIVFRSPGRLQEIPLVTLVKDAVLLFPPKNSEGLITRIPVGKDASGEEILVQGFHLTGEQLFMSKDKPYLIYGYAVVPPGKTLIIGPGTRIYFHTNSGIIVSENASMQVNGNPSQDRSALENEVIFQGDRLGKDYQEIPGQWGTIWFQKGSINNLVSHTTIKNAELGLLVEASSGNDSPSLQIRNTQIYYSAINGLRGIAAHFSAENLVINQSGQSSLHLAGGSYLFKHSTLVNYWEEGYRWSPAVTLENYLDQEERLIDIPLHAEFYNSIIYGNREQEFLLNSSGRTSFEVLFDHCLIRFEDRPGTGLYDFGNSSRYKDIILNKHPFFWNAENNDLRLQSNSPAKDIGDVSIARQVPFDILVRSRLPLPDLGAYEQISTEEN